MSTEINFNGLPPHEVRQALRSFAASDKVKINYDKLNKNLICNNCKKVYSHQDAALMCATLDDIGL